MCVMVVGSESVQLNGGRRIGYAVYGATEGRPVMFFSGTPGLDLTFPWAARTPSPVSGGFG
jgi:hypothetical protein